MPATAARVQAGASALAMGVLSVTNFLFVFDGMVVNLALPSIQHELALSQASLQWVITAYTLPFGGLLLLGGRLGDLLGRRRMLVCGLLVFAAGSLGAGLAPSAGVLIAARVVQGAGAAVSAPAALSLMSVSFPPGARRRRAFAIASVSGGTAKVAGAVLGGIITAALGWPWVFLVAVPVAAAAALLAPRAIPESRDDDAPPRLDVPGAASVTLGLALLVFAVTEVQRAGATDAATVVPGLAASALLGAFVAHEARARAPLLRLGLLRVRALSAATLGIFANSGAYTATVFLGSLYLQRVLGQSAFAAGLAFIPMALAGMVAGTTASRLLQGGRWQLLGVAGLAQSMVGFLLLALAGPDADYVRDVLPAFLLLGVGVSLTYVSLTVTAGEDVPTGERGLAYGIFESGTHIGGTVTLAVVATAAAAPATLASGLRLGLVIAAALAALGGAAVLGVGRRRAG
jgi:EmrB/QacA subfamily drug resistance transporter